MKRVKSFKYVIQFSKILLQNVPNGTRKPGRPGTIRYQMPSSEQDTQTSNVRAEFVRTMKMVQQEKMKMDQQKTKKMDPQETRKMDRQERKKTDQQER